MRLAIVNDSVTTTEVLRRIITSVPSCELAWVAADGAEAVSRCREDTPDLILMDLVMPVMDGAEATRRIMAECPCPILLVTATVEGHSPKVFEALGAGALDVVQTPRLTGSNADGAGGLKFKIAAIARLISSGADEKPVPKRQDQAARRLVAIGASAGGPAAIAAILKGLPRDFPAGIVVVQHVDARFLPVLVSWLNGGSEIRVRLAGQGDIPERSTVLVADSTRHLVFLDPHSLGYSNAPRECPYRPSIDVFFESMARFWRGDAIGVLLTGMGKDGAKGLKALRTAGFSTIAQEASSCVVYGMPKAAIELGAAAQVLPLSEIAGCLASAFPVSNSKIPR